MTEFDLSVQKFDEFASEYANRFMNIDSYKDSIDKFCDSTKTKEPRILELACGPGNITRYLRQRFPQSKILAVDLAPKMLDIAKQHLPDVEFRLMDVREILSLGEKFDLIMCSFCLPFLTREDSAKLIKDCNEILTPNGCLYISTMEGDESNAGFESTSFSGDSEIYFNYHRQSDIEEAFRKGGFHPGYIKRQEYKEPDGLILIDMIFIGTKK